jgi:hypothetical protein
MISPRIRSASDTFRPNNGSRAWIIPVIASKAKQTPDAGNNKIASRRSG